MLPICQDGGRMRSIYRLHRWCWGRCASAWRTEGGAGIAVDWSTLKGLD